VTVAAESEPRQGTVVDLSALPADRLREALNAAFDYRGDVTLHLADGSAIECYVFDRREGDSLDSSQVRIMLAGGGEKRTIAYAQIRRLEFSGKDAAAGKTWENWVRRYVEKHLAGERASIESESLD
jgi:hypothetical protein